MLISVLGGCGEDDCVVCPDETEQADQYYEVTYSYTARYGGLPPFYALRYNSKSGGIIDSLNYGQFPFWDVEFSSDGEFAYCTNGEATWIEDYATGDTLHINTDTRGTEIELSADGDYLLVSGSDSVALLTVRDLSILAVVPRLGLAVFNPQQKIIYFGTADAESLFVMDYRQVPTCTRSIFLSDHDGLGVYPQQLAVSPDGSRLFVSGVRTYVLVIDTESLQILQRFGDKYDSDILQDFEWHPDGKRLFMAANGGIETPGGVINIYDLNSGNTYRYLQDEDLNLWPATFSPADIEFTPDCLQPVAHVSSRLFMLGTPRGFMSLHFSLLLLPLIALSTGLPFDNLRVHP
jgi:WD40 repeat protein